MQRAIALGDLVLSFEFNRRPRKVRPAPPVRIVAPAGDRWQLRVAAARASSEGWARRLAPPLVAGDDGARAHRVRGGEHR